MPSGSLEMGYMDEGIPPTCDFNREHDNLVDGLEVWNTAFINFHSFGNVYHPN